MRLFRTIAGAQGGQIFANMGKAFGVSDELAAQAVRYFLSPISKAIIRKTESVDGLLSVLDFLGAQRRDRYLLDPRIFDHGKVASEGHYILHYLFAHLGRIRKIVANRTKVLPLPPDVLERMFPYVAVLAIGALEQRTRRPLGMVLHRLHGEAVDKKALGNPYAALVEDLRRRQRSASRHGRKAAGLSGVIGALFTRSESRTAA